MDISKNHVFVVVWCVLNLLGIFGNGCTFSIVSEIFVRLKMLQAVISWYLNSGELCGLRADTVSSVCVVRIYKLVFVYYWWVYWRVILCPFTEKYMICFRFHVVICFLIIMLRAICQSAQFAKCATQCRNRACAICQVLTSTWPKLKTRDVKLVFSITDYRHVIEYLAVHAKRSFVTTYVPRQTVRCNNTAKSTYGIYHK